MEIILNILLGIIPVNIEYRKEKTEGQLICEEQIERVLNGENAIVPNFCKQYYLKN